MPSYNKVVLIGNLTRDIELKTLPSGSKVGTFGLAVNRKYRKADGEEGEETTFVDIDAFGKSAETIEKYCKKGDPLMVEGRLRFRSWESENGDKRNKLSVILESFQFMPRSGTAETRQPSASQEIDEPW